jgi:phage I-like protein
LSRNAFRLNFDVAVGDSPPMLRAADHDRIALHAARPEGQVVLCQSMALPEGDAPEWIQLLPAGPSIATADGRGPYTVRDVPALMAASLTAGDRLPLDENHATDLVGPKGGPSPARGWIVALEQRADGVWGKVDWNASGKALMADRAYRFVSPVILHDHANQVTGILRAALVNTPNFRGMAALHSKEPDMNPVLTALLKALGLKDDADVGAALQAVEKLRNSASTTALQSALKPIGAAAGLKGDADAAAILAAVKTLAASGDADKDKTIVALQAEVKDLGIRLKTVTDDTARAAATTAIDAAIAAGKPGVKNLRDHYIGRHMADPKAVMTELEALPSLTARTIAQITPPVVKDGKIALNAAQRNVAKILGISEEAYAKTLAEEAAEASA